MRKKKPVGIVLWKGKSLLDGKRIMVIATGVYGKTSKNEKTGEMIQTYILRREIEPVLAHKMGEDYSICGNCMHREHSTCYVNLANGPMKVFYAYHDDSYKDFEPEDIEVFRDKNVRIGSYGDPAAVPYEVWENIHKVAGSVTGYSHQWRHCDQRLKEICMASVDSIKDFMDEYYKAQNMGWKTFRVRESESNCLMDNEFVCPASKEEGKKTTCEKCKVCGGLSAKSNNNISVILHGDSDQLGNWKIKRYLKIMKLRKNKKAWRRDYGILHKLFKKIYKC